MVSPLEGVVDDHQVAFFPGGEAVEDGQHAGGHGAQVRRDVGGLGDEAAGAVEERAGEVQALLDVGRIGCALERNAHLLGDAGEAVTIELEGDWVHRSSS